MPPATGAAGALFRTRVEGVNVMEDPSNRGAIPHGPAYAGRWKQLLDHSLSIEEDNEHTFDV